VLKWVVIAVSEKDDRERPVPNRDSCDAVNRSFGVVEGPRHTEIKAGKRRDIDASSREAVRRLMKDSVLSKQLISIVKTRRRVYYTLNGKGSGQRRIWYVVHVVVSLYLLSALLTIPLIY
jgi:hypothetical protein